MLESTLRSFPVNESLPQGEPHAVSVSMPTWKIVHEYVHKIAKISPLTRGYPRIFIPTAVLDLGSQVIARCNLQGLNAMPFPTEASAVRCLEYSEGQVPSAELRIIPFRLSGGIRHEVNTEKACWTEFFAVTYPAHMDKAIKSYWRYTGEGISSRHNQLIKSVFPLLKSPEDKQLETESVSEKQAHALASVEVDQAEHAQKSLCRFIAETASSDAILVKPDDVFLYPTGMCAIYHSALALKSIASSYRKNSGTMFGFPYTDTFKLLDKVVWTDCDFFGKGDVSDLDALEAKLASGRKICAIFCEFPSNPLLKTPNLARIHDLAETYGFTVACDDTVGSFVNVDLLPYVDVLMTSLTKAASGSGNVMGGSVVVSPASPRADTIRSALRQHHEKTYFPQDLILMESNCINMISRMQIFNQTAAIFADWFQAQPLVKEVYYPSLSSSKENYDKCLKRGGGYAYLLSIVFHDDGAASAFYDNLDVAKGPSLGLNFTLATAYTLLGHHDELDWAAELGVPEFLVRLSFGLEGQDALFPVFEKAMAIARETYPPK